MTYYNKRVENMVDAESIALKPPIPETLLSNSPQSHHESSTLQGIVSNWNKTRPEQQIIRKRPSTRHPSYQKTKQTSNGAINVPDLPKRRQGTARNSNIEESSRLSNRGRPQSALKRSSTTRLQTTLRPQSASRNSFPHEKQYTRQSQANRLNNSDKFSMNSFHSRFINDSIEPQLSPISSQKINRDSASSSRNTSLTNKHASPNRLRTASAGTSKTPQSRPKLNNSLQLKTPVSKFLLENDSSSFSSPSLLEFTDSLAQDRRLISDLPPKSKPFFNASIQLKDFVVIENLLSSKLKLHRIFEKQLQKQDTHKNPLDESVAIEERENSMNIELVQQNQRDGASGTESNMTIHLLYILYIAVLLQRVKDIPHQAYAEVYNSMLRGDFWENNIACRKDMQDFIVSYLQQVCLEAFQSIGITPSPLQKLQSKPTNDPYFSNGMSEKVLLHAQNDTIISHIIPKKSDIVIAVASISYLWIWTKREADARSLLKIVFDRKNDCSFRIPKREIAWMYYLVGESYMQEMYQLTIDIQIATDSQVDELRRQALFWFDRSVTLSNDSCWLALTRRSILRMIEEPKTSLRDLTKSITLIPYHPESYYNRALIFLHTQKLKDGSEYTIKHAIQDLTAVILMNREYCYEALLERSRYFLQIGKQKAAINDLTVAIQSFPKRALAYFNRSKILKEKSPQQAVIDLTIAISIIPRPDYYLERASTSVKLGRFGDALSDYTTCIRISKSAKALFKRASLLERLRKFDFAIKDLTEAINLDSTKAKYYAKRALIYFRNKHEFKNALEDFSEAISIEKINPQHYNNRGLLLTHLAQYENAIDDFNSAIDLNSKYAAAYMNRAKLKLKLRQNTSALKDMELACKFDPENDYYFYCLSGLYTYDGTVDAEGKVFTMSRSEAIQKIKDAIQISKNKGKHKEMYYARLSAFENNDRINTTLSHSNIQEKLEEDMKSELQVQENLLHNSEVNLDQNVVLQGN